MKGSVSKWALSPTSIVVSGHMTPPSLYNESNLKSFCPGEGFRWSGVNLQKACPMGIFDIIGGVITPPKKRANFGVAIKDTKGGAVLALLPSMIGNQHPTALNPNILVVRTFTIPGL
jgi:hypothetical protein